MFLLLRGAVTAVTFVVQREVFEGRFDCLWSILLARESGGSRLKWGLHDLERGRERAAFLSSSAFLLGLMAATMIGNYLCWLRSTLDPAFSLMAVNTISARYGMQEAVACGVSECF